MHHKLEDISSPKSTSCVDPAGFSGTGGEETLTHPRTEWASDPAACNQGRHVIV